MNNVVVLDFSGTLIKPEIAEEANLIRYSMLNMIIPSEEEHKRLHGTKEHYDIIREKISKEFGLNDNMKISYIQNYGKEIKLSSKDIKTIIMTDLFRIAMYKIAKEKQLHIFVEGIINVLREIKKRGYKLAIISGIRKDIVTGMLEIVKCPIKFDYIYGQDPVLSKENEQLSKELAKKGKIEYIIGDKLSDLKPAKKLKAKSIFVKWGHPSGGEEKFADYTINSASEILGIIK